jgi:hypothetical protein
LAHFFTHDDVAQLHFSEAAGDDGGGGVGGGVENEHLSQDAQGEARIGSGFGAGGLYG